MRFTGRAVVVVVVLDAFEEALLRFFFFFLTSAPGWTCSAARDTLPSILALVVVGFCSITVEELDEDNRSSSLVLSSSRSFAHSLLSLLHLDEISSLTSSLTFFSI